MVSVIDGTSMQRCGLASVYTPFTGSACVLIKFLTDSSDLKLGCKLYSFIRKSTIVDKANL